MIFTFMCRCHFTPQKSINLVLWKHRVNPSGVSTKVNLSCSLCKTTKNLYVTPFQNVVFLEYLASFSCVEPLLNLAELYFLCLNTVMQM